MHVSKVKMLHTPEPLRRPMAAGMAETACLLLEANAEINTVNKYGNTPLIEVSESGSERVMRLLPVRCAA